MVEKQWLGNKSGLGFYAPGVRKRGPHKDAATLWQTQSQGESIRPVPVLSEADMHVWIQNRLVTLMLLEAVRCLDEGPAKDADDLDCAMCLTGWATHRGGPIGYAQQLGADAVTARCLELAKQYGPRFAPFASLTNFLTR